MALFCRSGGMSLVRILRLPETLAPLKRCLRSETVRMKPMASPAVATPAAGLPIVEGSVVSSDEVQETRRVLENVNAQIADDATGRLFAVVSMYGKQFKVTAEDLVIIQVPMPVDIGDSIRLDKVLMVGARDFTLLGRPLLDRGLVRVDATVVEKTLSHTKRNFIFIKRSRYERHYFYRFPYTVLRINSVKLLRDINTPADQETTAQPRLTY
ncbi:hypothetical protein HPB48_021894 [Haemaphysalis longicornis]|uniref:Large ribosomal subunit protein bL21m n=1 Tax=Haemaphysalis longicornis TaxID=44386 RepID=A0A9J6H364_HAELO|nr:hypothetical protein HPB48_021894 [Haemaphysalis longicornis]